MINNRWSQITIHYIRDVMHNTERLRGVSERLNEIKWQSQFGSFRRVSPTQSDILFPKLLGINTTPRKWLVVLRNRLRALFLYRKVLNKAADDSWPGPIRLGANLKIRPNYAMLSNLQI